MKRFLCAQCGEKLAEQVEVFTNSIRADSAFSDYERWPYLVPETRVRLSFAVVKTPSGFKFTGYKPMIDPTDETEVRLADADPFFQLKGNKGKRDAMLKKMRDANRAGDWIAARNIETTHRALQISPHGDFKPIYLRLEELPVQINCCCGKTACIEVEAQKC
jgi:hypothetical protein